MIFATHSLCSFAFLRPFALPKAALKEDQGPRR